MRKSVVSGVLSFAMNPQRADDRGPLQLVKCKPGFLLGPRDGRIGLDRGEPASDAGEPPDDVGDFPLITIVVWKLDEVEGS